MAVGEQRSPAGTLPGWSRGHHKLPFPIFPPPPPPPMKFPRTGLPKAQLSGSDEALPVTWELGPRGSACLTPKPTPHLVVQHEQQSAAHADVSRSLHLEAVRLLGGGGPVPLPERSKRAPERERPSPSPGGPALLSPP